MLVSQMSYVKSRYSDVSTEARQIFTQAAFESVEGLEPWIIGEEQPTSTP